MESKLSGLQILFRK